MSPIHMKTPNAFSRQSKQQPFSRNHPPSLERNYNNDAPVVKTQSEDLRSDVQRVWDNHSCQKGAHGRDNSFGVFDPLRDVDKSLGYVIKYL